jgi:hypothetical protein
VGWHGLHPLQGSGKAVVRCLNAEMKDE